MQFSVTTKGIENLLCLNDTAKTGPAACFLFARPAAMDGRFWTAKKAQPAARFDTSGAAIKDDR
jgi:hypothetical protein